MRYLSYTPKIQLFILTVLLFVSRVGVSQTSDVVPQDDSKVIIQDLCWSPDERFLYFSAMKVKKDYSNFSPDLWKVYQFDFESKSVKIVAESALYVSVSPNGEKLSFTKNGDKQKQIFICNTDGSDPVAVTDGEFKCFGSSWSANGKQLVYVNKETGIEELFIINSDGKGKKRITSSEGHRAYNPSWSPDGEHIAYYLEKGDGIDQIHVLDLVSKKDYNVTNDEFNNIFPGWIDTNTVIYGQANTGSPTKLVKVELDGSGKEQVMQINSFYGRYSQSKSKIAYVVEKQGGIEIANNKREIVYRIQVPN